MPQQQPSLSIVIPARNEEANIGRCIDDLLAVLIDEHHISTEVIVVNDNSSDGTESVITQCQLRWPGVVRLIRRSALPGFGRAIRAGLQFVRNDVIVIYMADQSDHPSDVLKYHQTICGGYDCVYGSRFMPGARVQNYPPLKLMMNRFVNIAIQWLFWTDHNDLTNAFKAYRREVIDRCGPYRACHFNITLEMSLSALICRFRIARVPICWEGRTWGSSKLRMREMGRRYLCSLIMLLAQRILMEDDVTSEKTRELPDCFEVQPPRPSPIEAASHQ